MKNSTLRIPVSDSDRKNKKIVCLAGVSASLTGILVGTFSLLCGVTPCSIVLNSTFFLLPSELCRSVFLRRDVNSVKR